MSNVDHPKHYNSNPSGVEAIEIVRHMGFNCGNIIKYVWRADHKGNALEDLKKARWYLDDEIAKREKERPIEDDGLSDLVPSLAVKRKPTFTAHEHKGAEGPTTTTLDEAEPIPAERPRASIWRIKAGWRALSPKRIRYFPDQLGKIDGDRIALRFSSMKRENASACEFSFRRTLDEFTRLAVFETRTLARAAIRNPSKRV